VKAIIKRVGEIPELVDLPETAKAMQKIIGGPVQVIGSVVCTGNFVVAKDPALNVLLYNCGFVGNNFSSTDIYTGPWAGEFTDAGKDAINRYRSQAIYGNLGAKRWVWA
jgi:hypothetical protein